MMLFPSKILVKQIGEDVFEASISFFTKREKTRGKKVYEYTIYRKSRKEAEEEMRQFAKKRYPDIKWNYMSKHE